MANIHGPNIVTGGLVVLVDPANIKSCPQNGTLKDLSGFNTSVTQVGSITWSSSNLGVLVLDAGEHIDVVIDMTVRSYTVWGAARYDGTGSYGRIFGATGNNWLMGHWNTTEDNYYSLGWITAAGVTATDTAWRVMAASGNIPGDDYIYYKNGVAQSGTATAGSVGPNGLSIGSNNGVNEFSDCEVGIFAVYNRVLTPAEILQNFNVVRVRYEL